MFENEINVPQAAAFAFYSIDEVLGAIADDHWKAVSVAIESSIADKLEAAAGDTGQGVTQVIEAALSSERTQSLKLKDDAIERYVRASFATSYRTRHVNFFLRRRQHDDLVEASAMCGVSLGVIVSATLSALLEASEESLLIEVTNEFWCPVAEDVEITIAAGLRRAAHRVHATITEVIEAVVGGDARGLITTTSEGDFGALVASSRTSDYESERLEFSMPRPLLDGLLEARELLLPEDRNASLGALLSGTLWAVFRAAEDGLSSASRVAN